jgi:spore germination protein YaaH
MLSKIITVLVGTVSGMFLGYFLITQTNILAFELGKPGSMTVEKEQPQKKVIGFLPFWLIDKASSDYSQYITQLSYFNVVIDSDGSIQKFTAPGESDPGWHSLFTGKVDNFLSDQKSKGVELSLTVFSGDDEKINAFLEDPVQSAGNLVNDLSPILEQYGFKDLNLDIEKVSDASPDQRGRYTDFVKEVRARLNPDITITLDVVATSFVKNTNLCDPKELAKIADYIVLMGYDFHNPGSFVTGPVAPQYGAGVVSEFDIVSGVQAARTVMPASKLILAVPLYGYSWETIGNFPRAAVMPGSAYSISSRSIEELLAECTNCNTVFDSTDAETYTIYEDSETGLFHQVFYPDKSSTKIKADFARDQGLAGLALWALGYEGGGIMDPLKGFLSEDK